MKTLLGRVLIEKQAKNYNVFANLVDVEWDKRNQRVYIEIMDACLAHMESHIPCIATSSAPPWI